MPKPGTRRVSRSTRDVWLNGGRPLGYRKKSAKGALLRLELLRGEGIDLTNLDEAQRILTGMAKSLPDPPELDGHPVAIWY